MSTDLTLADLAADDSSDSGSGGSDDTGEWLGDLIDRLDERGYLDALITRQLDLDSQPMTDDTADGEVPAGENGGGDVDAEAVAQFGKMVIDQVGDVPMSTVVQYAENNPEVVDNLIQEAT